MDLRRHCLLMARYNRWALEKIYEQIDGLSDLAYRKDVSLFFHSIHGTLNHLLLVDHLWHGRMIAQPFPIKGLNDEIETDRAALRDRLLARTDVWKHYIAGLTPDALAGIAHYRKIDDTQAALPRASCILHVFNHATHHRGQISAALTQLGASAPEMDLPYFLYALPAAELG